MNKKFWAARFFDLPAINSTVFRQSNLIQAINFAWWFLFISTQKWPFFACQIRNYRLRKKKWSLIVGQKLVIMVIVGLGEWKRDTRWYATLATPGDAIWALNAHGYRIQNGRKSFLYLLFLNLHSFKVGKLHCSLYKIKN